MITIVIIEDNTTLRLIMKDLLQNEPDFSIVDAVADGASAIESVQSLHPDIAILDIRLPDMNGLDLIPLIKQYSLQTRVIVHSLHNEQAYIRTALKNGASEFVLKSDSITGLVKTIRSVYLNGR